MAEEFLSQDEVDALLKGVVGGFEEEVPKDSSRIRAYDFGQQARLVRGRMPALEVINDCFVRTFCLALSNFMQRSVEVSASPVKILQYSKFARSLMVPAQVNLVHLKPLRGTALFIFDPNLVFSIVDNLFGGDGRFSMQEEGRAFTPTEQRVIQRLLEVVLAAYKKSWDAVHALDFETVRAETNPELANIFTPNETVIVSTFNIALGDGGGDFHVCIPYAMIEPIRDLLTPGIQGERAEVDARWLGLMTQQVQAAEVELVAELGRASISLRQVMDMKIGDVIPLQIPKTITAEVAGVPVLECHYGERNGQYAVKVQRVINPADA